jgi:hypothetical protein
VVVAAVENVIKKSPWWQYEANVADELMDTWKDGTACYPNGKYLDWMMLRLIIHKIYTEQKADRSRGPRDNFIISRYTDQDNEMVGLRFVIFLTEQKL